MSRKLRQRKYGKLIAVQNWLEGVALRFAIGLFRLIPVDVASNMMGFFWRKLGPLNSRHKRALQHLEFAFPDMSSEDRQRTVRGMWDNLGRVAAETFHIDRLLKQDFRFEVETVETIERIMRGETACIFVSFHSANWELCAQPVARKGLAITGVYQQLRNPEADKVLSSLRKDLYKGGLLAKGHHTARKILATLKSGGIVGLMADLRETRGIQVPFFGRMAYANTVPASLARACNVPIVIGRVVRKKGVNFRIEAKTVIVPRTEDRQADITASTEEMHRIFEDWIREYPEQWMWIHRKWAPPGKTSADKHARRAAVAKVSNQ